MISLRNTWTKLCEALGPASSPALEPPAPPIWVAGVEYYGKISARDAASIGLDDDSSFPSMSDPPKHLSTESSSEGAAGPATAAAAAPTTTTTTTTAGPSAAGHAGAPPMRKVCFLPLIKTKKRCVDGHVFVDVNSSLMWHILLCGARTGITSHLWQDTI